MIGCSHWIDIFLFNIWNNFNISSLLELSYIRMEEFFADEMCPQSLKHVYLFIQYNIFYYIQDLPIVKTNNYQNVIPLREAKIK